MRKFNDRRNRGIIWLVACLTPRLIISFMILKSFYLKYHGMVLIQVIEHHILKSWHHLVNCMSNFRLINSKFSDFKIILIHGGTEQHIQKA